MKSTSFFQKAKSYLVQPGTATLETLIKNQETFLKFNEFRLKRAYDFMPKRTFMVFKSLPFLLHVNHHDFPGYIDNAATPCGICHFKMDTETSNALTVLFPHAKKHIENPQPIMPKNNFIRSLLLMGSIGSIAQTKKSDFDYWACINEDDFKPAWLERFTAKLSLIEEWADKEHGVETHFFPTDIKKVQKNIFGESDKESAGSSQAKLLKEEFYRTMILVMGKIPVWWILPAGVDDAEYERLKKMIPTHDSLGDDKYINLGNLYEISYEEFFGAALWQMNKAMDSPFKSVLKMGMLEGYIGTKGGATLLCTEIKKRVLAAEGKKLSFDPYMMMFDHILNYYQESGKKQLLDLLCKCFYIKIGVKANFDMLEKDKLGFKEKAVLHYIKKWGWNQDKLKELNSYKEWSFKKVLELGAEVHNYMIKTYQSLADRLKEESTGSQIITETDLTILGRKLFSFYSKKLNKLVNLRKAFEDGLLQDDVTFHAMYGKKRKIVWNIYRGQLSRVDLEHEEAKNHLLRQDYDLIFIIIWMVFNRICDLQTRMYLTPNPTDVVLADIQRLVKELYDFFPDFGISSLNNEDLLSKDKKTKIFVIINFFSDRGKWDVESVALFFLTTWGELFYENYDGIPKMGMEKVCKYIKELPLKDMENLPHHVRIFAPKGHQYKSLLENTHKAIEKLIGPIPALDKSLT